MSGHLTPHQENYQRLVREAKRDQRSADNNALSAIVDLQVRALGIPGVVSDFKFHPTIGWEIDRAFPPGKVGLEIQGGTHGRPVTCNHCYRPVTRLVKGRSYPVREPYGHGHWASIHRDIKKLNAAQELGWVLLLADEKLVKSGEVTVLFKRLIELRTNS